MNQKEKAEELLELYYKKLNWTFGDYVYSKSDKGPKECALVCVDELISSHNKFDENTQSNTDDFYYYSLVKQELEKL